MHIDEANDNKSLVTDTQTTEILVRFRMGGKNKIFIKISLVMDLW